MGRPPGRGRPTALNELINLHSCYGHHTAAALIAMIYLCAGEVTVDLPLH